MWQLDRVNAECFILSPFGFWNENLLVLKNYVLCSILIASGQKDFRWRFGLSFQPSLNFASKNSSTQCKTFKLKVWTKLKSQNIPKNPGSLTMKGSVFHLAHDGGKICSRDEGAAVIPRVVPIHRDFAEKVTGACGCLKCPAWETIWEKKENKKNITERCLLGFLT